MFRPQRRPQSKVQRNSFAICPKQSLSWLPFRWWLAVAHDIFDIRAVKPYRLNSLWLEYVAYCESLNLDHESADNYGLWG